MELILPLICYMNDLEDDVTNSEICRQHDCNSSPSLTVMEINTLYKTI